MEAKEKEEILALVVASPLPRGQVLGRLGLAKSTFYRWLKRQAEGQLEDRRGGSRRPWNKLRPEEQDLISWPRPGKRLSSVVDNWPCASPTQRASTSPSPRSTAF